MKNDNTKEKRIQTLPLLYYINKTLLCKQFIYNNLVSNCCVRLENGRGTEIRTQNCSRRMITVLETAVLPLNYASIKERGGGYVNSRHKS